ncbi:MAG: NADH-quinone oxidoreductase subunit N [Candidatus Velthaea sp.]
MPASPQYASSADLAALWPTFALALAGLVALVVDLFMGTGKVRRYLAVGIGMLGLVIGGVMTAQQYGHPHAAFGGAYIVGGFSVVFAEIAIVASLISLGLTIGIGRDDQVAGTTALLMWSTCGAMFMAGAGNLMMVFLGLELLSLGLYCLCAMSTRKTARESGLKYLLLSSMASGFLLYGMALMFGATGSVAFAALAAATPSALLTIGAGLFLVGIAFKLSLVPFHVWTPDVYEGAPLPVTAYMSVVTKAGTLAVLGRFAYAALPPQTANAILLPLWVLAAISMIVGNVAALAQVDMKRLLAYSGIAQVGYIVAAFAGQTPQGLRYAIFYLAAYTFMNLGAFAVVALMSKDDEGLVGLVGLGSFAGLANRRPWLAGAMTFFLLGLAGLPPTAGFTGKILILASTVNAGYTWLAALLIVGTAVSAYVYFKIVRAMFVRVDERHVRDERQAANVLPWISIALCAIAIFALGIYPLTPSDVLPLVK